MTPPDRPSRREVLSVGLLGGAAALALAACAPDTRAAGPGPVASAQPTTWAPPATPMHFPKNYTWGAATSAYQVEGSVAVDGRLPSIWDTFCTKPGAIVDGSSGEPADADYRLWQTDLDLLKSHGIGAYRLSLAWPRIQPTGSGPSNQKAIDHYRQVIDGLQQRGIRPAITLYHWDLPQPLQDVGGWAARETAKRFADYASIVFDQFGDIDADWFTLNEPKTVAYNGYRFGNHAPGLHSTELALKAVHHQLIAHGLGVQAFRAQHAKGRIGIVLNLIPVYPVGGATTQARHVDGVENRLFLDPLLLGRYPTDALSTTLGLGTLPLDPAALQALIQPGDLGTISTPIDVLGVNYYGVVGVDSTGREVQIKPTSAAGWQQVYAPGLYDLLTRIVRDYPRIPLLITENGIPDPAGPPPENDSGRIEFLRAHFQQAARAIADGVPLEGHYVWSLLDNFEWAEGFTQTWGMTAVDRSTMERRPKASAAWYAKVIAANAVPRTG